MTAPLNCTRCDREYDNRADWHWDLGDRDQGRAPRLLCPFTSTLPRDDGPDWPATPSRIFPSVPDHSEDLDVLALIEDDGPMVHIGGACLGAHEVRALVDHLGGILAAADQAVTP